MNIVLFVCSFYGMSTFVHLFHAKVIFFGGGDMISNN